MNTARVLTVLFIFRYYVDTATFATQCFLPTFHRGISNSSSIAEIWRVTAHDCLTYCIVDAAKSGDGCAAVVYHRHFSTCQLYGHDGTLNGAQIVYASGHDYYNRTSFTGICRDRQVPKHGYQMQKHRRQHAVLQLPVEEVIKYPNLHTIEVKSEEALLSDENEGVTLREFTASPSTPAGDYFSSSQPALRESINRLPASFLNRNLAQETCSSYGEVVAYFVFKGFESINDAQPKRLRGIEQTACSAYCTQNIEASGLRTPCYSIDYSPVTEECRLYGADGKSENGVVHLQQNEEMVYLDKFCISAPPPSSSLCAEESSFIVHPRHRIVGNIIDHSRNTVSVSHCVSICVNNPHCGAVTYSGGLCVLHDVNLKNDRDLLARVDNETVVIENGCAGLGSPAQSPAADWSEWSECLFGVDGDKVRVRSRDCGKPRCTDMQIQSCEE